MNDVAEDISSLLVAERPVDALRTYEGHMRSASAEALRTRFGPTMNLLRLAYDLDFEELALRHAQARKEERRRVRQATVQRILELADDERRLKRTAPGGFPGSCSTARSSSSSAASSPRRSLRS